MHKLDKLSGIREEIVADIPIPEEIFYFQSCVASNKYPGIESCTLDVLNKLGVKPFVSEDQTCCGGFVTFANVAAPTASMPAVARNISLAEEEGLDICAVCNGCWTFLNEFGHFMNGNDEVKESVNMMLNMMGREYKGESNIFHIGAMLYKLKDRIAENVERPLEGLKFATHYGCHYLGGGKYGAIDDAQHPSFIQELVEIMGGENVDYTASGECCGTGFTQVINDKEKSLDHSQMKLESVRDEADPDFVIVLCPYCLSQLDRMQQQLDYRRDVKLDIPIIHITQLAGLALGLPKERLAFDAHIGGQDRFKKALNKIGIDY
ncbi:MULTISPECIES: CoB--CoM heterodisulfide reductase iron-sulfur subunit B family protein [unclassified Candidatus Frackibacter]|jgi:heterodisulfide reductase subunit B|uniref:CoB--CoM heterodisulfide reductase iron-sulfur subunit B family protein n=1 Tax=unclassified Candidatus Frackibacter TaxID=2648818 RepID=UPI0007938F75|nr:MULTISPECIES: CoB--CoM heterodisulfide reductase iron-sulfur subunit B family protein [unclassified Candidatus Frackibacter]KXS43729.1 MAG: heterodisulfide reductase subunit B [Candidatus Frackibacter sp. T328-2]SDC20689.1 CoB--CoM heterodisulfide reductase subunit B [Candidatus Frackibacter sp. WG11]SEM51032.1 CoB--CoM heterodisulfide reductase subunit B [Candidatus Frackibacter sp. WG12]SFL52327.1 CoB--CoM heterodisulfide reductase subunit B [Candidatus Frackibacter sp. WG13]